MKKRQKKKYTHYYIEEILLLILLLIYTLLHLLHSHFSAQLNKSLNVIILLSFSLRTFCFQLDFTPLATPKKYNSTYIQQRKEEDPSTKKEKKRKKKRKEKKRRRAMKPNYTYIQQQKEVKLLLFGYSNGAGSSCCLG